MATETKLNKGNKMKTFKFFNTDHMNKFIAIYENSTFIYSHYDALKIIDDKTIQINDIDVWNDSINEYRDVRAQYEIALVREQVEAQQAQQHESDVKKQHLAQQKSQVRDVYRHVTGHYWLSHEDASEFIKTMSNPSSISMDNLVSLFRMQKGGVPAQPVTKGPSETFQQSRNAQQVPSPMGVMPGQATQSNRSDSDTIMDDIITDFKNKNPWGK